MLYLFLLVTVTDTTRTVDSTQGYWTYDACAVYETVNSHCEPYSVVLR